MALVGERGPVAGALTTWVTDLEDLASLRLSSLLQKELGA